ncbi:MULTISPECIES: hypothetical protein [unclassified Roseivivax]|uniref:hypothetical protein n=1 Tax=Roseivivax sp. GX 12232 TaxID=2900547 RepID=UPI001E52E45E|nr:hypothetical protein [Roseivivax sp. GX 12232]MCE0505452.1 hypothetical protein [Roseivivax sp. GX 12232]
MRSKLSVVAALAAMSTRIGLPDSALAQEAIELRDRCETYLEIDDRGILLNELENLLELDPDDPCIPFLVDLLGGSPLAQATSPY